MKHLDDLDVEHCIGELMSAKQTIQILDFIKESNKIEGINRNVTEEEAIATNGFLSLDELTIADVNDLVMIYQPDARIRCAAGMDVYVSNHKPIPGGPEVTKQLFDLLKFANDAKANSCSKEFAWWLHCKYEKLHPYTDGNGRSGRAIWAWMYEDISLGFLHRFYYQSLDEFRETEKLIEEHENGY